MILIIIGWLGVILCTMGYLLLSTKVIKAERRGFQLFNIIGGGCLVITAIYSNDLPNVVANLLWMFIGVYALGSQMRNDRGIRKD